MMGVNTSMQSVSGNVLMLAMMLATFATFAQEEGEDDDMLPAVDTSVMVEEEESAQEDVTRTQEGDRVMDSLELGRTEIKGNQELPKVLYIVPWQKSDPGDLMGRPVNTLLDEVLAPLDREEFVRQVEYHNDLYDDEEQ